jgi:hypothetical protein
MLKSYFVIFLLCFSCLFPCAAQDSTGLEPNKKERIIIEKRKVPDSVLQRLRSDDDYWYIHQQVVKKKEQRITPTREDNLLAKKWFRSLMWVLIIGGFVAVMIWYLAVSNIRIFRTSGKKIKDDEELISEDIFSINYDLEIDDAIRAKNFRKAVRLFYLQVLKKMSDNGIIEFKPQQTNTFYLHQLKNTGYYSTFSRLTRNFEYTWYGGFTMTPETFSSIQNDFLQFKKSLGK